MTGLALALRALVEQGVEFVVIGAVAAVAHGSTYATQDLDLCYERSPQNLERLVAALGPLHPSLRDAPATAAWRFDVRTLKNGMNFTLSTDVGDIDLFGEVAGVGPFSAASSDSIELNLFGSKFRIASLRTLISSKRAAGRPKDLLVLQQLEALLELNKREG